jgi:hypothetical protein
MNKTEAVAIAAQFARDQGYDPVLYTADVAKKASRWQIDFRRRATDKPGPGDFFTVYVNATSKSVYRLVPGK